MRLAARARESGEQVALSVASSRAGDRVADLEYLVRQHSPALVRTLTLVVLDRELAADIAQETFLRLYTHWDQVATHPDLVAWLYRVALNRASDHRRSLARAARLIERLGANVSSTEASPQWVPETEFISTLRTLPRGQRAATALH